MKKFNVTGICIPEKHYMVDISNKIDQIKEMVDDGKYFTINRARQYGKTTTLSLLMRRLQSEYTVIRMSFEGVGETMFESPKSFCERFLWQIDMALQRFRIKYPKSWQNASVTDFDLLKEHISKMCEGNKVVLIIDETDKTSSNRIFLQFLGILRDSYLLREEGFGSAFHSVILAGVYDIKNIKLKIANEIASQTTEPEGKLYNSPWNIAAAFDVDMSFQPNEIATMLNEYEEDHKTGMDIEEISKEIYGFTNGYPFLVSRICQCIDGDPDADWTLFGIKRAIQLLLMEQNTLFDDMSKNLENNSQLYEFLYRLLIVGETKTFSFDNPLIRFGTMYGYLTKKDEKVFVSNKVFEIRMTNYFISKDENTDNKKKITGVLQYDVVHDGIFDMELCLRKFADHYKEVYNPNNENDVAFMERHGRMVFLTYLKPLLNGKGFYHIESGLTDLRRMDIVVDYGCDQFIIELKRWKGETGHTKAYKQLAGYLDAKNASVGYLVTFDLRKKERLQKTEWIEAEGKRIFDVIV